MKKRRMYDLGTFHKEATRHGLTYAQAQIQETCEKIGPVRAPLGMDPEHPVYQKLSAWKMMRKANVRQEFIYEHT